LTDEEGAALGAVVEGAFELGLAFAEGVQPAREVRSGDDGDAQGIDGARGFSDAAYPRIQSAGELGDIGFVEIASNTVGLATRQSWWRRNRPLAASWRNRTRSTPPWIAAYEFLGLRPSMPVGIETSK
jgi:hypothetical protein